MKMSKLNSNTLTITQKINKRKPKTVNINTSIKLDNPVTTKGKHRYIHIGTLNPLYLIFNLLRYLDPELVIDITTVLALASDTKGDALVSKEICLILEGLPASKYGNYVSAKSLGDWKVNQTLKEVRTHKYTTHNARTCKTNNVKHLSDLIIRVIIQLVDTPFNVLFQKLVMEYDKETFELLEEKLEMPKRNSPLLQEISDDWFLTLQRNNTPEVERTTRVLREWRDELLKFRMKMDMNSVMKMDAALLTLEFMFPTVMGGQRDYVIDKLYQYYVEGKVWEIKQEASIPVIEISSEREEVHNQEHEMQSKGVREVRTRVLTKEVEKEGYTKKRDIYGILNNTSYISSPIYLHTLTYLLYESPILQTTKYQAPPSYVYNSYPCTTLSLVKSSYKPSNIPFSTSSLISAYNFHLKSHPHVINTYNSLALNFLTSYIPTNDLEKRCKQVMVGTGKAFPLSYMRLSACPRIYAEGKDNLFYCPTPMRHAVCEDLGLKEWDMKSCHTYILLGLYGKSFPVLKGMVERNSIWKEYEAFFQSNNCVFNKQVIKAFHYATILGGGTQAYKHSIKKLSKEGIELTPQEVEQLISVYKKHPVVREMKSFINKWGCSTKQVVFPSGETHEVIPPTLIKDSKTGKKVKDYLNSNVLEVFSGLLRSWEMVLISYVGLSHPEAFTILLHQHDGITVLENAPNAFELAQEAMREISTICFPTLSKPIELEIKL